MDSRRTFIAGLAVAGAARNLLTSLQSTQMPRIPQKMPSEPESTADTPGMVSPEKHALDENEKEIKKKVERLYVLATELKAEVDKTDSTKVLSLMMIKKTEEIEKLAKEIRTRSKG